MILSTISFTFLDNIQLKPSGSLKNKQNKVTLIALNILKNTIISLIKLTKNQQVSSSGENKKRKYITKAKKKAQNLRKKRKESENLDSKENIRKIFMNRPRKRSKTKKETTQSLQMTWSYILKQAPRLRNTGFMEILSKTLS